MKNCKCSHIAIKFKSKIVSNRRKLHKLGLSPKFYRRKKWIFSRTACLGSDSAELIPAIKKLKYPRKNFQKSRIDHLNILLQKNKTRVAKREEINDAGIFSMVQKQKKLNLKFHAEPLLVLFDTYSELTDQEFVTSDGRRFYANYSDVNKQKIDNSEIKSLGRMDPKLLYSNYFNFCSEIYARWPGTKIIFITYPTTFESRLEYLLQSDAIEAALNRLTRNLSAVNVIKVPEDVITAEEQRESFPYHFGLRVKNFIAKEIELLIDQY